MNIKKYICVLTLVLSGCSTTTPKETTATETELPSVEKAYYENVEMIETEDDIIVPFNTTLSIETLTQEDMDVLYPIYNQQMQYYAKLFDAYHIYTDQQGNPIHNIAYINENYELNQPILVEKEIIDLLSLSNEMVHLTSGAFNYTMGGLTQLWSPLFSPFPMEGVDPDKKDIDANLACIVSEESIDDVIVIDKENSTITITSNPCDSGIVLDLGGIAKGYAIDLVSEQLSSYDIPFLVNGGTSSIACYTPSTSDKVWYVGLRDPYARVSLLYDVALDTSLSMTTSGDDGNYFLLSQDDTTIIRHHILDPFSGYSCNYIRTSTIVSSLGTNGISDALSTALFNVETDQKRLELVNAINDYYDIDIAFATLVPVDELGGRLVMNELFTKYLVENTTSEHVYSSEVIQ